MSDDAERERAKYEALAALVDNYRRERDDAREQLYMTKAELGRWVDRETKAVRERDEARAEVERLREMAHDFEAMRQDRDHHANALKQERREVERLQGDVWALTTTLRSLPVPSPSLMDACMQAYKRGAEAMREACAQWVDHWASEVLAEKMRALPIPEEQ